MTLMVVISLPGEAVGGDVLGFIGSGVGFDTAKSFTGFDLGFYYRFCAYFSCVFLALNRTVTTAPSEPTGRMSFPFTGSDNTTSKGTRSLALNHNTPASLMTNSVSRTRIGSSSVDWLLGNPSVLNIAVGVGSGGSPHLNSKGPL